MPMYEYKCESCEIVFSELRKISERTEPIACPECGGQGAVVFSLFAKGGGGSLPDSCPARSGTGSGAGGDCPSGYG
jgi:putative FmdB family regulatory protein